MLRIIRVIEQQIGRHPGEGTKIATWRGRVGDFGRLKWEPRKVSRAKVIVTRAEVRFPKTKEGYASAKKALDELTRALEEDHKA